LPIINGELVVEAERCSRDASSAYLIESLGQETRFLPMVAMLVIAQNPVSFTPGSGGCCFAPTPNQGEAIKSVTVLE
jgi:hypothetical protein